MPIRRQLIKLSQRSSFILTMDIINTVCNGLTYVLYLLYIDNKAFWAQRTWYITYIYIIHGYFFVDFLVRIIISQYPRRELTNVNSIIDLLTTIPFFVVILVSDIEEVSFRTCMMLDTLRLFLTKRLWSHIQDDSVS